MVLVVLVLSTSVGGWCCVTGFGFLFWACLVFWGLVASSVWWSCLAVGVLVWWCWCGLLLVLGLVVVVLFVVVVVDGAV